MSNRYFPHLFEPIRLGKSEVIAEGRSVALLAVGSMVETALQVKELLEKEGCRPALVNVRFVKPMDTELLDRLAKECSLFVTMEDNVEAGGFGEAAAAYVNEKGYGVRVLKKAIPDKFVEHGPVNRLREKLGLDAQSIVRDIDEIRRESR